MKKENDFKGMRALLFPIHASELKRFIPMALMMLFILFNYTVLRNVKDSLVVNARGSDADIISFLKLWGTMPAAVLVMLLFSKLSNIFNREKLFYIFITPFLLFFASFALFIYPNVASLHPDPQTVYNLQQYYPNLKWFIAMWGNWSYCLFYILSELWGSVFVSLMFWQFANAVTTSTQAKRFYPLFGFIGNLGLVGAGYIVNMITASANNLTSGYDHWQYSLNWLMALIVISGLVTTVLYRITSKVTASTPSEQIKMPKKKKPKLSMGESFKYIFSSSHLLALAVLVLAYGITVNYIDVLWKGQVKLLVQGDKNAYAAYMGSFSTWTGIIALPLMLIGGNLLRKMSWSKAASIVPTILAVSSLLFFGLIIYGNTIQLSASATEMFNAAQTAVELAVLVGFWQGALIKASKYSLFDATKEMAYIPLDEELKTKGKAAVDVAGGRLGKSGGALTFCTLQTIFPSATLPALTPYLAGIATCIFAAWFIAVGKLGKSLKQLNKEDQEPETATASSS